MSNIGRLFGKPYPLRRIMERGEEFFDAITATPIDEVLERSRHMSRIAFTAATIAGEKLQLEGDGDSKRLIFAAYLNLGDLTNELVRQRGIEATQTILSADATRRSLLMASGALNSIGLDKAITQYIRQGAYFDVHDSKLSIDLATVPKRYKGRGCPYAHGDKRRADYFNNAMDHVVTTHLEAWRRDMPQNLIAHTVRRIVKNK